MWNEFMQMSSPAAFVLAVFVAAPCSAAAIILSTWSVNRTTRRRQELEHLINLRKTADGAKMIEEKRRRDED